MWGWFRDFDSSGDSLEALGVCAVVSASWLLLGCAVLGVQSFQIDLVAQSADFLFVTDELAVGELIRRVLDKRVCLFGSLPVVEVHLELAAVGTLLGVDVVLEVDQEFLQRVDSAATGHIGDHDRGLEDRGHVALSFDLFDALGDHFSDLGAHDLRDLAAILPEDVGDALLAELAIDTHVEFEVLVNQHSEESSLATSQMRVVLRALVEHDVGHVRLNLLDPVEVLLRKLECLLRVVLELDGGLVCSEVLAGAEGTCDACIPLLFPATSVALYGRTVGVRLARDFYPLGTAAAVDSNLSFAGGVWARLVGMARVHTLVAAGFFDLEAPLTTAVLHQVIYADETAASWMADLLAFMAARKLLLANLATVRSALVAEDVGHQFLATAAQTRDRLEAWWTRPIVTPQGAWVATGLRH